MSSETVHLPKNMRFKLVVVATADGFIAKAPGHAPSSWASREEQEVFFAEVDAADWSVMGRGTHEAADRPDRRRVIFSAKGGGGLWKRPTQLWIDPARLSIADLPGRLKPIHPVRNVLILGGTRVHDWFLERGAINEVLLTIEPVRFEKGLPIVTGQTETDALSVFTARGFVAKDEAVLNAAGTRLISLCRSPLRPDLEPAERRSSATAA